MAPKSLINQVTAEQLAEYLSLEEERKELERKARAIAKRSSALGDHFKLAVEASGKQSLVRAGYRLTLIEGTPRVAWKDAFIEKLGPLAANELTESAPRPMKLDVQKVA